MKFSLIAAFAFFALGSAELRTFFLSHRLYSSTQHQKLTCHLSNRKGPSSDRTLRRGCRHVRCYRQRRQLRHCRCQHGHEELRPVDSVYFFIFSPENGNSRQYVQQSVCNRFNQQPSTGYYHSTNSSFFIIRWGRRVGSGIRVGRAP